MTDGVCWSAGCPRIDTTESTSDGAGATPVVRLFDRINRLVLLPTWGCKATRVELCIFDDLYHANFPFSEPEYEHPIDDERHYISWLLVS